MGSGHVVLAQKCACCTWLNTVIVIFFDLWLHKKKPVRISVVQTAEHVASNPSRVYIRTLKGTY